MEKLPSALNRISLVLDNVANTFEDADNDLASGMEGLQLGTDQNPLITGQHDLDTGIPSIFAQFAPLLGQVSQTNPIWDLFGHQGNQTGLGFLNNANPVEGFLFGLNSGLFSSLSQSTGGSSSTPVSGTSNEVITSNGYRLGGMELRPEFEHDSGFAFDPDASPTFVDYISYAGWGIISLGAHLVPGWRDSAIMYSHFRRGTGASVRIDYQRAYREDRVIREAINREVARLEDAARELIEEGHSPPFEIIGDLSYVGHPETANWLRTLGLHQIFGHGRVRTDIHGNLLMDIEVHTEDFYNFNPGQGDKLTGIDDGDNGRFSELGWAQEFMTYGSYAVTVDLDPVLNPVQGPPVRSEHNRGGGALGVEPNPDLAPPNAVTIETISPASDFFPWMQTGQ